MAVPFLIPVVGFAVSYRFYGEDLEVVVYTTFFCLMMAVVSFMALRGIFWKYLMNRPAFILKDDAIETATGKQIRWEWFDKAVVFRCEGKRLLGLHRKSEVDKATVDESSSDFAGIFFGLPFAIQFDQFTTEEDKLIKLFHSKLPVVVNHKNYDIGDEVEAEAIR